MFAVHSNKIVPFCPLNVKNEGHFLAIDEGGCDASYSDVAFAIVTTLEPEPAIIIGTFKQAFDSWMRKYMNEFKYHQIGRQKKLKVWCTDIQTPWYWDREAKQPYYHDYFPSAIKITWFTLSNCNQHVKAQLSKKLKKKKTFLSKKVASYHDDYNSILNMGVKELVYELYLFKTSIRVVFNRLYCLGVSLITLL